MSTLIETFIYFAVQTISLIWMFHFGQKLGKSIKLKRFIFYFLLKKVMYCDVCGDRLDMHFKGIYFKTKNPFLEINKLKFIKVCNKPACILDAMMGFIKCKICDDLRPSHLIGVVKYFDESGAIQHNIQYCKDKATCIDKATSIDRWKGEKVYVRDIDVNSPENKKNDVR